jgi:hypothetical protein
VSSGKVFGEVGRYVAYMRYVPPALLHQVKVALCRLLGLNVTTVLSRHRHSKDHPCSALSNSRTSSNAKAEVTKRPSGLVSEVRQKKVNPTVQLMLLKMKAKVGMIHPTDNVNLMGRLYAGR